MYKRTTHLSPPLLLALVAALLAAPMANAQDLSAEEKVRGKVIGRIWHTNVNGGQFFSYTKQLTEELELPTSPIMMMMGGGALGTGLMNSMGSQPSDAEQETRGTLIFLESSPEPGTPRFIGFRSVKDHAEYLKLVKKQSGAMFGGAELIGKDDRHEVRLNLQRLETNITESLPGEGEEGGGEEPRAMSFSIRIGTSISSDGEGPEAASAPEMPTSISTYYRYHDGFMYLGQLEAIHSIDLPSGKTLTQTGDEAAMDIRGQVDLREIPRLLKQHLWTSLQTRAMTYLQRFDNEKAEDHAMRSAVGKGRLELLKAAMFDVDEISFSLQFAKDGTEPIQFELQAEARDESQLASSLSSISRGTSSLKALRDSDSPMMVSTTVDLPDWMKPLALSFAASMQGKMKESAADDSVAELIDQIFLPIADTLEQGKLDAVVRMEGDAATGATLFGGLKLLDAQNFQTALETLMVVQSAGDGYRFSQSKAGDQSVLTLSTTADFADGDRSVPVTVHLAGQDGYLWFVVGGDSSLEVLKQQLLNANRVVKSAGVVRPLEVRLKLSEWLGSEGDEFSRLPEEMLQQLERSLSEVFDQGSTISMSMNGKPQKLNTEKKFQSYADKVLTKTGGDLSLEVQTTGKRLNVRASVGTQVVKFLVAQYVVAQNRMFQNISFDLPDIQGLGGEGTQIKAIRIGR